MNTTGRRDSLRKLRNVIDNMPPRGASRRPVRERPPSMKYSSETPRANNWLRYSRNTAEYNGSPLKLRRRKNAPARRRIEPSTGRFKFTPAPMCGIAIPLRSNW